MRVRFHTAGTVCPAVPGRTLHERIPIAGQRRLGQPHTHTVSRRTSMHRIPEFPGIVSALLKKGVSIPAPSTVYVGDEVDPARIAGEDVVLYPGCRIGGAGTVIARGARIGREGPVTIEDCRVGPNVELAGGFFSNAVFLSGSGMGLGAHVRKGTILEEQAHAAHCVGLKQTILFPYVTLGSLINFCDCLMSGGTGRRHHSEVGSSYIHFNFTPDGDKATPSLMGDVPRGVMLNQPPIFLGGQGGMVGPLAVAFGTVAAAGSILRRDVPEPCKVVVGKTHRGGVMDFVPHRYPGLARIVERNIRYVANLNALEQWYIHVRRPFFRAQELGELIYEGAVENLASARTERLTRLEALAHGVRGHQADSGSDASFRVEFTTRITELCDTLARDGAKETAGDLRDSFLNDLFDYPAEHDGDYLGTITGLPEGVSEKGVRWLDRIVESFCDACANLLPSLAPSTRKT